MSALNNELRVPRDLHGQRIDVALARLLPLYSRSQLSQWLKQGLIQVNQRQLKPKDKVMEGDVITIAVEDEAHQQSSDTYEPEFIPLDIVYEDDALLVVNKQAGLVVHPGAGNPKHTLVNALLHHAPQLASLSRAGIVHRLDKDTTGLLVVAKTLPAHTSLVRQMQERDIQRRYVTLVQGHVISGGEIDTFFGRHPRNRLKMAVLNQGRQAVTLYTVKRHYDAFTLLDVQLLTGRTHQIRVHMAHINHPVVGDPLYGGRPRIPAQIAPELREALQSFKRQALHAASLSFHHPEHDDLLTFTAPLPDDFQSLINSLDEYLV
ncbi:23S rRNA pseudouridine(1911/1915/1917) synthase RluD [Legionella taurinensis]|uniref:Pseudouridine synthase n=1 Tax=Legionella taurinensis TaxID=70611 RepID=A0A3A5LCL3_9GAMM|nr:23S rRNA pseudouridine(1911/1915/1917) synthase RluD [Legionella taurinensis]MDX1837142.1 23S rRNA pseudouridine(1911/1915/1917) synthase RluD [Legionella taurinensis]PUT40378.1 23S rRNA pseudouridine(1911/1915/1917) synthase RluD [Legionella taurinensis]PUT40531.1 23S rRNA pseudouridine(1911/1915/1917) synthase RluD [Legionella taurinensis]PUT42776.1 23S rRNA pseudouridine(1911/1915/1917) synthase RluD [Legionella taurinensis]PUT48439.1 23S rRNA pseudouridine(1911/1915/1917) synthase RluD 